MSFQVRARRTELTSILGEDMCQDLCSRTAVLLPELPTKFMGSSRGWGGPRRMGT